MGEDPLQRVAGGVGARSGCVVCWLRGCGRIPLAVGLNWGRWRCVRLLCGGPNPLTRGLTALRCLCVSAALCEHVLFWSVCGDGGATRVCDRSERNAWANPPRPPRCCCRPSPTLCWVDGARFSSLRWSPCMWCASRCVDDSIFVAASHIRAYLISFSFPF
ncbi:putative retrotransposon hot spot protein (RHS) [Trypanosoma cruzi]|uniref:Putative retrotransposon hot spot protein (RHS) n=1 Tax=Trypanosoma cruzi TaxID=5693 RepID=A0A2V2VTT8_TRYCR|nr:putative retrotransposon hot spot protein (RHS) [Trypanosoma cruzi]RNC32402.1 putative retrotransposon hot spot (RHS) protein [Trypanosoma cruzi]